CLRVDRKPWRDTKNAGNRRIPHPREAWAASCSRAREHRRYCTHPRGRGNLRRSAGDPEPGEAESPGDRQLKGRCCFRSRSTRIRGSDVQLAVPALDVRFQRCPVVNGWVTEFVQLLQLPYLAVAEFAFVP